MDLSTAPLFASIPAQDIGRAMRWYEEKLGLRSLMDLGVSGQLYQSGGVSWLMYETPSAGTGKHTLAGWVVPSIDDAMRDMRAKGVVFEEYDMGDHGPTTENGVARGPDGGAGAWFKDSEGNILSISELPPGMHALSALVGVATRVGLTPGPRRSDHLLEVWPLRMPVEHIRRAAR